MDNEYWIPELRAAAEERKRRESGMGAHRLLYFIVGVAGVAIGAWAHWAGRGEEATLANQSVVMTVFFGGLGALCLLGALGVFSIGTPESTAALWKKMNRSSYDGSFFDGGDP